MVVLSRSLLASFVTLLTCWYFISPYLVTASPQFGIHMSVISTLFLFIWLKLKNKESNDPRQFSTAWEQRRSQIRKLDKVAAVSISILRRKNDNLPKHATFYNKFGKWMILLILKPNCFHVLISLFFIHQKDLTFIIFPELTSIQCRVANFIQPVLTG